MENNEIASHSKKTEEFLFDDRLITNVDGNLLQMGTCYRKASCYCREIVHTLS